MNGARIARVDWSQAEDTLMNIRLKVFVEEQGVPLEMERDHHDATALHLLATAPDGAGIATARLLDDGHIGRMAVLPAWRGIGVGTAMLRELIHIGRNRAQERLFLYSQADAVSFYKRLGFIPRGKVFQDAGIPHQTMTLELVRETLPAE